MIRIRKAEGVLKPSISQTSFLPYKTEQTARSYFYLFQQERTLQHLSTLERKYISSYNLERTTAQFWLIAIEVLKILWFDIMNDSQLSNATINGFAAEATRGAALRVVESCILIVLQLSALVGNIFVCLAFYRNPSLRSTITNYFLLSLALTDLSMAVLAMPLSLTSSIANKWVAGDFGCKLFYVSVNSLIGSSLLTVMFIAVNRYLHVSRPALCLRVYSKTRTIIMAVSAWIVSIALQIVWSPNRQFRTLAVQPTQCFQLFPENSPFIAQTVLNNISLAIPSLVIVICYIKIWQTIRHHNTPVVKSSQERNSAYGVEEARLTKIMTAVVVGFFHCWLPLFISNILKVFDTIAETVIRFSSFCYLFPTFANSVINPVIYATMSRPFKKEFLNILRRRHH